MNMPKRASLNQAMRSEDVLESAEKAVCKHIVSSARNMPGKANGWLSHEAELGSFMAGCCQFGLKTQGELESNTLFIGIDEIDHGADVIAMVEAGLFLAHLQAGFDLVVFGAAVQDKVIKGAFFGIGPFDVLADPIADLAVGDALADDFDEGAGFNTGGFKPGAVEAFGKIIAVVGVELAGQVEADFVDETGQVNPAIHHLTRTSGINDISHVGIISFRSQICNKKWGSDGVISLTNGAAVDMLRV